MGRKARVTRTIAATDITVLVVDCESAELHNETITASGKVDEKSALKIAKKTIENDEVKVVKVVALKTDAKLYAMDEDVFIQNAEIIGDGRTTKD